MSRLPQYDVVTSIWRIYNGSHLRSLHTENKANKSNKLMIWDTLIEKIRQKPRQCSLQLFILFRSDDPQKNMNAKCNPSNHFFQHVSSLCQHFLEALRKKHNNLDIIIGSSVFFAFKPLAMKITGQMFRQMGQERKTQTISERPDINCGNARWLCDRNIFPTKTETCCKFS